MKIELAGAGLACLAMVTAMAEPAPMATVAYDNFSEIHLAGTPSVDAAGEKFAFEWCDRLWLAPVVGGQAVPVRQPDVSDTMPVLSPDGRRIAFIAREKSMLRSLVVMDLDSGEARTLSANSEPSYPYGWTPDGKAVVCEILRDDEDDDRGARAALIALEPAGRETLFFDATAECPSLSPNGEQVLFTRWGYNVFRKHVTGTQASQVWLYDRASRQFRSLVAGTTEAKFPRWTPDGKAFYYLSGVSGVLNLVRRDIRSGLETKLTNFTEDSIVGYSVSANGRVAVFRQGFDFWRLDLTQPDAAPERIALRPAERPADPKVKLRTFTRAWNNDYDGTVTFADNGMQIAFTAGGDLWAMDTVIRQPRLVHGDSATHERECVFSADGNILYWLSDRGDRVDLMQAEREDARLAWWENRTFREKTLVSDGETRYSLKVSPDGKHLSWLDMNGCLIMADLSGKVVAKGPTCIRSGSYCFSPDGKWVAQTIIDRFANSDVWIYPVDGSVKPFNVSCHFKWDGDPVWSPDGKILAFSGFRPDYGSEELFYVYLDPQDEVKELETARLEKAREAIRKNGAEAKKEKGKGKEKKSAGKVNYRVVLDGLRERVRRPRVKGSDLFFRHDSRTLGFAADGETKTIHLPDALRPVRAFGRTGRTVAWIERDNRLLRTVGGVPAHGDTLFNFTAYQELKLSDYRRLGFLSAWERLNNRYYDAHHHGADMKRIHDKYLRSAEEARTYSAYRRVMQMLIGELDSSHLSFGETVESAKFWGTGAGASDWRTVTAHTGLRFERGWTGEGWKVRDVLPGGPAERQARQPIRPGDLVLAVNGRKVGPDVSLGEALNGPAGQTVELTVKSGSDVRLERLPTESYATARERVLTQKLQRRARVVHERTSDRLGYLYIPVMNQESYYKFEQDLFREGYGREGLIIDVRGNSGGFITDQLLASLCGVNHAFTVYRNGVPGYLGPRWARPYWFKPLTVLCDQDSCSNAEIFSHAIKTLKRGRVVGVATGGNVISTFNPPLLDLGYLRQCTRGWFRLDGTDMEQNGAQPDVEASIGPDDEVAGRDPQLEAAIRVLTEDVEKFKRENSPLSPKYPHPIP